MKKFLLGLMIFCMTSAAWGDVVYSTTDGKMGLIKISSATSLDLRGVQFSATATNPIVGTYWDNGKSRVAFVAPTTDKTTSGDVFRRFDPDDLTKALDQNDTYLTGVYGTKKIGSVHSGHGIYFISGASIHEYDTNKLTLTRSYTFKSSDVIPNPQAKDILVDSMRVYLLMDRGNITSGDSIQRFDGQIAEGTPEYLLWNTKVSADAMDWLSNGRIGIAHSQGVDILSGGNFQKIISADTNVKAVCKDTGDGFYYATLSGDNAAIYHYLNGTRTQIFVTNQVTDTSIKLLHDDNHNNLVAIIDSGIRIFNMGDMTQVASYTSSQLGGVPYSISKTTTSGESSSSSSSGCEIFGLGFVIIPACFLIFYFSNKRREIFYG